MKAVLISLGVMAYAIVLPWSTTQDPDLFVAAMPIAMMFYILSMTRPGMLMVAGMFMFLGVIANLPPMATFGAILSLPFAVMDKDK